MLVDPISRAGRPVAAALQLLAGCLTEPSPPATSDVLGAVLTAMLPAVPPAAAAAIGEPGPHGEPGPVLAATDQLARAAEKLQAATGQGPSWDAADGAGCTAAGDELWHRWPEFGRRLADETGVRAVLSRPLPAGGVVTFYALEPFAVSAEGVCEVVAACGVARSALAVSARAANLEVALSSSRQIAAAVGIVMAQCRCPYDEAFRILRAASQRTHRKVRDLADEVLFTGALPEPGAAGPAGG